MKQYIVKTVNGKEQKVVDEMLSRLTDFGSMKKIRDQIGDMTYVEHMKGYIFVEAESQIVIEQLVGKTMVRTNMLTNEKCISRRNKYGDIVLLMKKSHNSLFTLKCTFLYCGNCSYLQPICWYFWFCVVIIEGTNKDIFTANQNQVRSLHMSSEVLPVVYTDSLDETIRFIRSHALRMAEGEVHQLILHY